MYKASDFTTSRDAEDLLGCGSFAVVRKCNHTDLGEVVVKCFSSTGSEENCLEAMQECVNMFYSALQCSLSLAFSRGVTNSFFHHSKPFDFNRLQREARILVKLEHEHIVRVFGITSWANYLGFAMEIVPNGNLEDLLMSQSIEEVAWVLRLQFIKEISDGLSYLHSRKVVHGDLKSQNILLGDYLTVKLADFGAAEIFKTTEVFSKTLKNKKNTQCTPIYTAPEYLKNPNQPKTTQMDMYR